MLRPALAVQPVLGESGLGARGQRIGFEAPDTGRDPVRDPEITVSAGSDAGDSDIFRRTQAFAVDPPRRRDAADLVGSLGKENIAVATAQDMILRAGGVGAVSYDFHAKRGSGGQSE